MKMVLAAAWTLLIVALCMIPGDSMPDVDVFSFDKLGHFVMFCVLAWLWLWTIDAEPVRAARSIVAAGIAFAVATEVYQGLLPFDREPSVLDAIADTAGLLFGVWTYRLASARRSQAAP